MPQTFLYYQPLNQWLLGATKYNQGQTVQLAMSNSPLQATTYKQPSMNFIG